MSRGPARWSDAIARPPATKDHRYPVKTRLSAVKNFLSFLSIVLVRERGALREEINAGAFASPSLHFSVTES